MDSYYFYHYKYDLTEHDWMNNTEKYEYIVDNYLNDTNKLENIGKIDKLQSITLYGSGDTEIVNKDKYVKK